MQALLKKILIILISIAIIGAAALFIALRTIDPAKYTDVINQAIESSLDAKIASVGLIQKSILRPKIIINSVQIKYGSIEGKPDVGNTANIKKIEIIPRIGSGSKIKEILIYAPDFTLSQLKKALYAPKGKMPKISIAEGKLNIGDKKSRLAMTISEINLVLHLEENHLKATGSLATGRQIYQVSSGFQTAQGVAEQKFELSISSPASSLSFSGYVQNKKDIEGQVNIEGQDLQELISSLGATEKITQAESRKQQEKFELYFNIKNSEEIFKIEDLHINSTDIAGKGFISQTSKAGLHVELDLDKLNLDNIVVQDNSQHTKHVRNFDLEIPENFVSLIQINIKEAIFKQQSIKDIAIKLNTLQGKLNIYPLTATLPGNTELEVKGQLSHNKVRPKLEGKLEISSKNLDALAKAWTSKNLGKELKLSSSFDITTGNIILRDIKADMDETTLAGMIKIKTGPYDRSLSGKLHIDRLKYDHDAFISTYLEWKKLEDLSWLRSIKLNTDLQIDINEFILKEKLFNKAIIAINILNSEIRINQLALYSPEINLLGRAIISAKSARPYISIDLESNQLNYDLLIVPSKKKDPAWSTEDFELSALENFNGDLSVRLENFTKNNIKFDKIMLQGKIKDDLLIINQLQANLYNGTLEAHANLGISTNPSLNAVFAINNLQLDEVLKNSLDINHITGYGSMNGSITSQGKSMYEWASNASGELDLAMRDIKIQNFNISWLADNLMQAQNYSELIGIVETALYTGETTLNSADGKVSLQDGKGSLSLKFRNNRVTGAAAANLVMAKFIMSGVSRFLFIPLEHKNKEVVAADLRIKGPIYKLNSNFDIESLNQFLFLGQNSLSAK
ncbi:hypothetical protein RLOatenuis_3700 [Rickettsiales bacterium]|nr:hypothetical protein RLOatenuis_3700 [Rickettsiales bacterium]